MIATYYEHNWHQEPDSRWFSCYNCGELSAYNKDVGQWVTVKPQEWTQACLRSIEWDGEL